MATELKLPDLGEDVADVTISAWRVAEGDSVNQGDIILEVATDKVDTEVPATIGGTVLKINVGEGEIAPVDAVLAIIGEAGEEFESSSSPAEASTKTPEPDEAEPAATAANGASPAAVPDDVKASPVAIRVASDQAVALDQVKGTGPGGRITKADVLAVAESNLASDALALPDASSI